MWKESASFPCFIAISTTHMRDKRRRRRKEVERLRGSRLAPNPISGRKKKKEEECRESFLLNPWIGDDDGAIGTAAVDGRST